LSEYLDNRLAANERAHIEQHLRDCADCRAALESLRWTMALVKHAPAPALPRAFTLPVPAPRAQRSSFAFGFAQFGAALATLLLIAVIGVDVITQFGGGMSAPMVSTAKEFSVPTLEIAAAPQAETRDQMDAAAPTAAAVARPTMPPAPTKAPMPTAAPPAAAPAPMSLMPTATISHPVGASAMQTPDGKGATADGEKVRSATVAPRVGFAVTATATISAPAIVPLTLAPSVPTITAISVPPTLTALPSATRIAQARAPQPTQVPHATVPSFFTPLRVIELGLLFLAIFFGVIAMAMWRKK